MTKETIVITGATGKQGGSVVTALLKEGNYHIKALTRDTKSAQAEELVKKGAEVVQGDIGNRESLAKAFHGADIVFATTNFWDKSIYPNNIPLEEEQGKLMADVAKEQGVKLIIWCTLPDTVTLSNGKLKLPHFTGKAHVEQHINKIGLPALFVEPGFYMENLGFFGIKKTADGVNFTLPFHADTKVPFVDISTDTGAVVAAALKDRKNWLGKRIPIYGEILTPVEAAAIYQKVSGDATKFYPIPLEGLEKVMGEEMAENMQWMVQYGYYHGDDVTLTKKLGAHQTTFEEWLRKSGWRAQQQ